MLNIFLKDVIKKERVELRSVKAFTLVELMITFTVIVVLAAVFAPIVSKKMMSEKQNVGSSQNLSEHCEDISEHCQFCDLNIKKCIQCALNNEGDDPCSKVTEKKDDGEYGEEGIIHDKGNEINCKQVKCYYNSDECKCHACSIEDERPECKCDEGYHKNAEGSCVQCNNETQRWNEETKECECTSEYTDDGSGNCVPNSKICYKKIGNLYWTLRNPGDGNCAPEKKGSCQTKIVTSEFVVGEYSGRNRTVCTRDAAELICKNIKTRNGGMFLPAEIMAARLFSRVTPGMVFLKAHMLLFDVFRNILRRNKQVLNYLVNVKLE